MLVEFDFGNFRSFKEEASFSMEPLSQNGDNINVIGTNLKRIPQLFRTSGIFGANASGKSNILMALKFVAFVVRNSSKSIIEDEFPEEYYALSENGKNVPMTFTIKFIVDSLLYEYSFSLSRVAVEYESLYCYDISETGSNKANRIFERQYIDGKSIFKKSAGILQSWCNEVIDNRLFLSDIVNNRKCKLKEIQVAYDWIVNKLRVVDAHKLTEGLSLKLISEGNGDHIVDVMKKADLGLEKILVKEISLDEILQKAKDQNTKIPLSVIKAITEKRGKVFDAKSYHKTEEGDLKEFDFNDMESDGTKNFLALIGPVLDVLKEGKILVVDEMDDALHPYLVRYLIDLFNSPKANKNNAQFIFTSHAHYLMDGIHLTRDQIWLTAKDLNGGFSSSLYSLSDFKDVLKRKNISFQEAYLDGIYGAVPNVEIF